MCTKEEKSATSMPLGRQRQDTWSTVGQFMGYYRNNAYQAVKEKNEYQMEKLSVIIIELLRSQPYHRHLVIDD